MQLMGISNAKRLRQIANTLVKHGLGHFVKAWGLETSFSAFRQLFVSDGQQDSEKYSVPERLTRVLEELGPTFIKLGQALSTRRDQLPPEYIRELARLQDQAAPLPFSQVDEVFRNEFDISLPEAFAFVDERPLASGSIGQVHAARLKSGDEVVVKIRRPGIEQVISADIRILYFIAHRLKRIVSKEKAAMLAPVEIVREFESTIMSELDFAKEGRNIEQFMRNFKENAAIHFPRVFWEFSSSRVLVMEKIQGVGARDVSALRAGGHDLNKIASTIFDGTMKQMFVDAFFHADPHPGNFIIMNSGVIAVIDCGMVGTMEDYFMDAFVDCITGLFLKDYDLAVKGYLAVGTITEDTDIEIFKKDLREFSQKYMNLSSSTLSLGIMFDEFIEVAVRNEIRIPAPMLLIARALMAAEGTIRKLSPGFDFTGTATNFARKMVVKRRLADNLEPRKIISELIGFVSGMSDLLRSLPKYTSKLLSTASSKGMGMDVNLGGSESFYKKLDSYVFCISLSLISSGLAVGSSLVIHAKIEPLWFGVSALGLFGYSLAVALGLWVVFTIVVRRGK